MTQDFITHFQPPGQAEPTYHYGSISHNGIITWKSFNVPTYVQRKVEDFVASGREIEKAGKWFPLGVGIYLRGDDER